MKMSDLHRRLLQDVLEIGNDLPFVITGGYAVQAHGIVERPSRDIDVATDSSIPMEILAARLVEGLTERGWKVQVIGIEPVSARFMVADRELGQNCEVDILKGRIHVASNRHAIRSGSLSTKSLVPRSEPSPTAATRET